MEIPPITETPFFSVKTKDAPAAPVSPRNKRPSSAFENLCRDLLRDEHRLQKALQRLTHSQPDPVKLLELQSLVYGSMQRVELVSRCVQTVQNTLQHLRQGQ